MENDFVVSAFSVGHRAAAYIGFLIALVGAIGIAVPNTKKMIRAFLFTLIIGLVIGIGGSLLGIHDMMLETSSKLSKIISLLEQMNPE